MKESNDHQGFIGVDPEVGERDQCKNSQPQEEHAGASDDVGEHTRGNLKKMPVTVEMATANPMASGPTPNETANSGKTGVRARL
jgi:hypothetical protein